MADTDMRSVHSHLDLEERVRRRAHEIWMSHQERGPEGELEDWLQAEREVLGADPRETAQNRGSVVGDAHTPDPSRIARSSTE